MHQISTPLSTDACQTYFQTNLPRPNFIRPIQLLLANIRHPGAPKLLPPHIYGELPRKRHLKEGEVNLERWTQPALLI